MSQDVHLLRGLLQCEACERGMVGLYGSGGYRKYTCGPRCQTPELDARTVETDMLLAALIRGAVMAYPEYGTTKAVQKTGSPAPLVDADTMAHWQRCDFADRRQVLMTAFSCIHVTREGELRPVWRHAEVAAGASS